MKIPQRVKSLRAAMQAQNIQAYIIPSSDPHQSEYVAEHWQSRAWISGFTGSAGTAIVTATHAGIWTDSRYFIQAEQELADTGVTLHKQKIPHAPEHLNWLLENLAPGARIGLDGRLFSIGQIRSLKRRFGAADIEIVSNIDLIEKVWQDRPALPDTPIFEHPLVYAGTSRGDKLHQLRKAMKEQGAAHYLISTLDDVAWLFNLRGSDIAYNPLFYAFGLVSHNEAALFVHPGKLPEALQQQLQQEGIAIYPYDKVHFHLDALPDKEVVMLDPYDTNGQVYEVLGGKQILESNNILRSHKAIKTTQEVEHIKAAMVKDGIALLRLFRWLEATVQERPVPEAEVARQLADFRREQGDYYGESFGAIVGYKGNGAIVHYRPAPATCASVEADGILLLDSGGQYINGTTDITRTVAMGPVTAQQKRHYTLVLKGHIALARAIFPAGTTGAQLDTLARYFLWQDQLNYGHGTGHGVGYFLNVHEPPQGFATNPTTSRGSTAFVPGMFTSNEPGFYLEGEYGIRTENLVLCVEAETPGFLKFETLTLFPIDQQLIDADLLSPEERQWLNDYHAEVAEKLGAQLKGAELDWLMERCQAI